MLLINYLTNFTNSGINREGIKTKGGERVKIYRWVESAQKYFITCPYCKHHWASVKQEHLCPQCKSIFSEELVRRLNKLSKALSK